jgi:hypothetical protein
LIANFRKRRKEKPAKRKEEKEVTRKSRKKCYLIQTSRRMKVYLSILSYGNSEVIFITKVTK